MRVWQVSSFGVDSLEFVERPDLEPGPGEVLVRVRAISLNYRDLLMVNGRYNPKMQLPRIPCSDGAGEVMATARVFPTGSWQTASRESLCRTGSMDFRTAAKSKALSAETSMACWPSTLC